MFKSTLAYDSTRFLNVSSLAPAGPTACGSVTCIAAMTLDHSVCADANVVASSAVPIALQ